MDQVLVNDVAQPLRMQGQYWDEEIALCYNRYRYFDPQICSFISQDPIGISAGENVYAFAPNVWGWVDPLGLSCEQTVKKGPIPDAKPNNLTEQLVLEEAKSGTGEVLMRQLGDEPRLAANYGTGEWVKMEHLHITPDGRQVNVHWFRNQTTSQNVEFKFKYRYNDKVGNIKPTLEPKVHPSGL